LATDFGPASLQALTQAASFRKSFPSQTRCTACSPSTVQRRWAQLLDGMETRDVMKAYALPRSLARRALSFLARLARRRSFQSAPVSNCPLYIGCRWQSICRRRVVSWTTSSFRATTLAWTGFGRCSPTRPAASRSSY